MYRERNLKKQLWKKRLKNVQKMNRKRNNREAIIKKMYRKKT